MKNYKHGKQVLRAALALALVFCLSVVSLAAEVLDSHSPESTVTLRRKADAGSGVEFVFSSDRDLWDSFKNMMPGDTMQREITVRSEVSTYDVYFYARLCDLDVDHAWDDEENLLADEKAAELISVKVWKKDAKTGALTELQVMDAGEKTKGVDLGRFRRDSEVTLVVEVSVSPEMGNQYQEREGYIDWIFYAEQYISSSESDNYTLTIQYYDMDGNTIHTPYKRTYTAGRKYDVTDLAFDTLEYGGAVYTLDHQEGDELTGIMDRNRVIDLYYDTEKPPVEPVEPVEPPVEPVEPPVEPVEPVEPEIPDTGDSGLLLPAVLMVVSGSALCALLLFAPRRKDEAGQ
ncbi:MAG: MucBP domain-containing protein [Clostridia bacterium]|nr:MucBP domain-containing protein [Clostridia bacterium]